MIQLTNSFIKLSENIYTICQFWCVQYVRVIIHYHLGYQNIIHAWLWCLVLLYCSIFLKNESNYFVK